MRRNRGPSAQVVSVLRALAADASRWRYGYDLGAEVHLLDGAAEPVQLPDDERVTARR
jgi:PadR family transcriptional regulator, regulatory protein PadR